MKQNEKGKETVQISITMDKELKQQYSKLALEMDLSFSSW